MKTSTSGGRIDLEPMPLGRSRALLETAGRLTPGGVHSNIRLAEQPLPLFFDAADGAYIRDVDGNELIDYVLGMGPMLLGHRPAEVIDAVVHQLGRGILYAGQHDLEIAAAERVQRLVPCAERLRFNVTGTEAVQAALRLARAATGRQRIVKFQGHYHGWTDSVLVNVGTRGAVRDDGTLEPVPETLGSEHAVLGDVIVVEWNDADALEAVLRRDGGGIAAVIMEPVMANSGVIPPADGYLADVRRLCDRYGTLLIFDEVITGFRVGLGGAQGRFGVTPDLATFGKALASGFPVACVAGRADLFEPIATGGIMHAGTFNANPVGLAAAVAALDVLADPARGVYEGLERHGTALLDGIRAVTSSHDTAVLAQGLPMLFSVTFTQRASIRNHYETLESDTAALRRFLPHLLNQGVRIAAKGIFFLSAAHGAVEVERTIDAFDRALTSFERA